MADRFIDLVGLTADLSLRTMEARLAKIFLEQPEGDVIPLGIAFQMIFGLLLRLMAVLPCAGISG